MTALWSFIWFVAGIDICFACVNASTMPLWEANPVQNWVASTYGVGAAVALRLLALAFGAVVINSAGKGWKLAGTVFVAGLHVWLLGLYLSLLAG